MSYAADSIMGALALLEQVRPSEAAPPKPREPRRVTVWRHWANPDSSEDYVDCREEQTAKEVASRYGGHYYRVEIVEERPQLPTKGDGDGFNK